VDDILICSKDQKEIDSIKLKLSKRFAMKDLGKTKNYVGITIDYDTANNVMNLSQKMYIESLVKKYNYYIQNTPKSN
jgi:Reverse transcriptase (RNA-dependent DNA polymerase)